MSNNALNLVEKLVAAQNDLEMIASAGPMAFETDDDFYNEYYGLQDIVYALEQSVTHLYDSCY